MVRSATDIILENLKDENLKDLDKKREIEKIVGPMKSDVFAQLVGLAKKITDFGKDDEEAKAGEGDGDEGIDDDVGVAVVFEDDDDEEEDEEGFEVRSEDDDDEDDEEEGPKDEDEDVAMDQDDPADGDEAVVIGTSTSKSTTQSSSIVQAREIDGFWLQRRIAQSFPDPLQAAELTTKALALLSASSNKGQCENALMELTEYEHFELVKVLVENREKIVWCTKLARSDENEKVDVKVAMREVGVGWILKELEGGAGPSKSSNAMDVDSVKPDPASSKLNLVPGTMAPPPRKVLDLAGMAFSQGARLMSNKKCKLPEGSFKRTKKGYEEVHVPAPKRDPPAPGELVPVSSLPEWAREAFKGNPTLNRIQSKLYPVAFGTDEPILLCAPTGAGKVRFLPSLSH